MRANLFADLRAWSIVHWVHLHHLQPCFLLPGRECARHTLLGTRKLCCFRVERGATLRVEYLHACGEWQCDL